MLGYSEYYIINGLIFDYVYILNVFKIINIKERLLVKALRFLNCYLFFVSSFLKFMK